MGPQKEGRILRRKNDLIGKGIDNMPFFLKQNVQGIFLPQLGFNRKSFSIFMYSQLSI